MQTTSTGFHRGARRSFTWALAMQGATIAAGFSSQVILARILGADEFGRYSLVVASTGLCTIVLRFGFHRLVVREPLTRRGAERDPPVRSITTVYLLLAASAALMGAMVLAVVMPVVAERFYGYAAVGTSMCLAFAVICFFESSRQTLAEGFRTERRDVAAALHGLPLRTVLVLLGCSVVYLAGRRSLSDVIAVLVISSAVATLAALIAWRPRATDVKTALHLPHEWRELPTRLRAGFAVMVTDLSVFAMGQGALLIIAAHLSPDDVGRFSVAVRIAALLATPAVVLVSVVAPLMSSALSSGEANSLQRSIRRLTNLGTVLLVVGCTLAFVLGERFLTVAFGVDFAGAASSLAILSLAQLVNMAAGPGAALLITADRANTVMLITLSTSALVLVSDSVAAQVSGMHAVACVAAAGIALQQVLLTWVAWRITGIKCWVTIRLG